MKSKFPGTCCICKRPIPAGAEIEWSKETGARHIECKPPKENDPDWIQLQKDIARGIVPLKGSPF